jgi:histidinol-phosphate aminotransferase
MTELGLIPREVGNYGLPEYLRISIGLEEDNRAVVQALTDFMKS